MSDGTEVRALLLQINANTELLRSNLSEAEKAVAAFHSNTATHLDDFDKRWEGLGKSVERLEAPLEHLKRVAEVATAALVGEGFLEAGKHALEFAGNVSFLANQIGVSTDFLQKYNYAASQFGVSNEVADTALTKFSRTIGEVANGDKSAIEMFDRLGVKIFDSGGKIRSTEAIFADFSNGIAKLDSPAQRVADTMSAFGRGAAGLAPLLGQGAAGFNELAAAAAQLGIVLSPELIEHSEQMNHKMAALKSVLDAQMASAIAQNASQLEGLATSLINVASGLARVAAAHPQTTLAALGLLVGGPAGAAVGAGLASGNLDKQIRGSEIINQRNGIFGAPAVLLSSRQHLIDAADEETSSKRASIDELYRRRQQLRPNDPATSGLRDEINRKIIQIARDAGFGTFTPQIAKTGGGGAGVTNDSGQILKTAQADLAALEKQKVGSSGAALTAYNEEIATKKREIAFIKEGATAQMASSLASKEGAAISKGENDARRAARKAEEDRRKALQDDLAYRAEELRLRKSLLEGARASAGNDAQRDALQKAIVNEEADTLKATVADKLAKGGYGKDPAIAKARADNILLLNEQNRQQGIANVDLARAVQDQRNVTEKAALQLQGQGELLGLDDRLATTRSERLKVELQLLDYQEQQAKAAQQAIIDSKDPRVTDADRRNAQTRKDQIDAQHSRNVGQVQRQNADPLQAYGLQLRQNVGDMNDALKGVEVDGLRGIEDGLTGLIDGTETVAGAFKKMAASIIADLARIAIEKAIISFIPGLGLKDGGQVPRFAEGGLNGPVRGPGGPRSDSIVARLSNGEFVINAHSTAKHLALIEAINRDRLPGFADGGSIGPLARAPKVGSLSGAGRGEGIVEHRIKIEPSPMFDAHVDTRVVGGVMQLSPYIIDGAKTATMKAAARPGLPRGAG